MAEMSEALVRQIADLVESQIRGRVTKADAPVKSAACGLAHGVSAAGPTAPPPKAPSATSSNDPLVKAGASRVGLATERPGPQAAACRDLNAFIDHTLLKQAATEDEIRALCNQAREHRFASVCVNPSWVSLCVELLRGSGVMVCTVVGFPLGATTTGAKVYETREAVAAGADEIDMVLHIGRLKEGDFRYVCDDIRAVVAAAQGKTVKVIIETSLINNDEKVAACILSKAAGAHFVKTSTGFAGGGATVDDVALMRKVVGEDLGVKASGGIRSCDDAEKLVAAGADRLGASASVAIVSGGKGTSTY